MKEVLIFLQKKITKTVHNANKMDSRAGIHILLIHCRITYWDEGDYLTVRPEYRRNNSFGGKVVGAVEDKVGSGGNVPGVLKQN